MAVASARLLSLVDSTVTSQPMALAIFTAYVGNNSQGL